MYGRAEQHRVQASLSKLSGHMLESKKWYQRHKQDHCHADKPDKAAADRRDAFRNGFPRQDTGYQLFYHMKADHGYSIYRNQDTATRVGRWNTRRGRVSHRP